MKKTNLKPRDYEPNEVCRIINPKQRDLYIINHAYPIDIYPSIDKNNNPIIVYIFLKKDTQELYKLWKNYELE